MTIKQQIIYHKGHRVATSIFGSEIQETNENYRMGFVPPKFVHRPDLIAKVFYNNPGMFWKLMIVNRVPDPFEGFNSRDIIYLP